MTPPEAKEISGTSERTFKAGDLLKLIGLTYRQLNDWEDRAKIFEQRRSKSEGWRKFTPEEVTALAVCASLRRQFSLPLEKVGELYRWLLDASASPTENLFAQQGRDVVARIEREHPTLLAMTGEARRKSLADDASRYLLTEYLNAKLNSQRVCPIRYAFLSAKFTGEYVYLYTDFEAKMILFEENLAHAFALRLGKKPAIVCPLNNVFDELLIDMGKSPLERDKNTPSLMDRWKQLESRVQVTRDEEEVLRLLRSKRYQRVTVHLKDGQVLRADCEGELPKAEATKHNAQILNAVADGGYCTVMIQKRDGQIVRLTRTDTMKFQRGGGKPLSRD